MTKEEYIKHISNLTSELERAKNGLTRALMLAREVSGVSEQEFNHFSEVQDLRSIEEHIEKVHKKYKRGVVGNQIDLIDIE